MERTLERAAAVAARRGYFLIPEGGFEVEEVEEGVVAEASWDCSDLLHRAVEGGRLSFEEGLYLYQRAELLDLAQAADALRQRKHPDGVVTFLVDRNINYGNVCTCYCSFCAFYRAPGSREAYLLSEEELARKIEETVRLGGTRILMQGGVHPRLDIAFYEEMLRRIKARFEIEVDAFSPVEVINIARLSGLSVRTTLGRLKAAGLDGLPGGGAEILVDRVRRRISPLKTTWRQWAEVMATAQGLGLATSATMVFGFGESLADRILHLVRVREIGCRREGDPSPFTAFILWSYQPERTGLRGRAPTGVEYLRLLAMSRLMLDNFANIQASWVTQGPKMAQVALRFGANDFGSTMIEENVVSAAQGADGGSAEHGLSREQIIAYIRAAGFVSAQRDTRYNILRTF